MQLKNFDQTIQGHSNPYPVRPNFTILTKFHNVDQIWQFWPNPTILTKFQNFDQISKFDQTSQVWPNFTIWQKFTISMIFLQFWPNFTVLTKFKFQGNIYNANNAYYTDNAENTENADNADNKAFLYVRQNKAFLQENLSFNKAFL